MGKGKKKGQVQDDWENEMEEIAAEATGIDLTISLSNQNISFSSEDTLTGRSRDFLSDNLARPKCPRPK